MSSTHACRSQQQASTLPLDVKLARIFACYNKGNVPPRQSLSGYAGTYLHNRGDAISRLLVSKGLLPPPPKPMRMRPQPKRTGFLFRAPQPPPAPPLTLLPPLRSARTPTKPLDSSTPFGQASPASRARSSDSLFLPPILSPRSPIQSASSSRPLENGEFSLIPATYNKLITAIPVSSGKLDASDDVSVSDEGSTVIGEALDATTGSEARANEEGTEAVDPLLLSVRRAEAALLQLKLELSVAAQEAQNSGEAKRMGRPAAEFVSVAASVGILLEELGRLQAKAAAARQAAQTDREIADFTLDSANEDKSSLLADPEGEVTVEAAAAPDAAPDPAATAAAAEEEEEKPLECAAIQLPSDVALLCSPAAAMVAEEQKGRMRRRKRRKSLSNKKLCRRM